MRKTHKSNKYKKSRKNKSIIQTRKKNTKHNPNTNKQNVVGNDKVVGNAKSNITSTKNQLVRKFTIGEWIQEREPKIVIFSQNMDNPDKIDLIVYEKHTLDYVNKSTDRFDFDKELSIGKWNHKKYTIDKENSIYILNTLPKMTQKTYYDSYMDDGLKDFDEIYYAVSKKCIKCIN